MVVPAWTHTQISAEQYDSWTEEQCAGIEIVDGMVVVSPTTSKRHNLHHGRSWAPVRSPESPSVNRPGESAP